MKVMDPISNAGETANTTRKDHPLEARLIDYSVLLFRLCRVLERDNIGRLLGHQLVRAGTSVGANLAEAQAGQSRADFVAKLSVAHKEARETAYWLQLIRRASLCNEDQVLELQNETDQIVRILSSSLLTAKRAERPSRSKL